MDKPMISGQKARKRGVCTDISGVSAIKIIKTCAKRSSVVRASNLLVLIYPRSVLSYLFVYQIFKK